MIDPTFLEDLLAGFALKLILNAISTGANILKGLVFGNRMINLTVANDKVLMHITVLLYLPQSCRCTPCYCVCSCIIGQC